MEKERDLGIKFGMRKNIIKENGKKESKMVKVIFIIKEKEFMQFGKKEIL